MLLPQSTAFNTLRNRLNCAGNIVLYSTAIQGKSEEVRFDGDWEALLGWFKEVQGLHEGARRNGENPSVPRLKLPKADWVCGLVEQHGLLRQRAVEGLRATLPFPMQQLRETTEIAIQSAREALISCRNPVNSSTSYLERIRNLLAR